MFPAIRPQDAQRLVGITVSGVQSASAYHGAKGSTLPLTYT